MSSAPFFHPELLSIVSTYPQTSDEWKSAISTINTDIKSTETLLRAQFVDFPSFQIQTEAGYFTLQTQSDTLPTRLCYKGQTISTFRPLIELPLTERLESYRQFPQLFEKLLASEYARKADEKANNVATKTMFEIIREIFERVKDNVLAGPKLERLIEDLKKLRTEAPKDDSDIRSKAHWFKRLAETLLESNLLQQVFEQVKTQIPQIWSQLTLAQKLKLGAVAPIVGAGAYLGGIGIAGGGSAIGLPVVIVILLLLMMNHTLVDFLDWLIKQLSIILRNEPSTDAIAKTFEEVLNAGIKAAFGKDYGTHRAEKVGETNSKEPMDPRRYEALAVSTLAKKYSGVGYLTRYSSDGGIDGYIVCEVRKEVLLVQAKHYQNKVGFPEVTQYLGTYFYWKKALESQFPFPISKMILACSTDYSIEAKKVADTFPEEIILEKIHC